METVVLLEHKDIQVFAGIGGSYLLNISRKETENFYIMEGCMEAVKEAFRLFSLGKVQVPLKIQIKNEGGTGMYPCMPAYCKEYDASCVKVLNMFPENIQKGIPTINAQILVMNTENGTIEGIVK